MKRLSDQVPSFRFRVLFLVRKRQTRFECNVFSVGLGMILMGLILITEFIVKEGVAGRLSWPYGDLVPGNYLAKTCMPVLCVLAASAASSRFSLSLPSFLVLSFSLLTSFLTGERVNLILALRFCRIGKFKLEAKVSKISAFFALYSNFTFIFECLLPVVGC